jgi:LysM repeat protein
MKPSWLRTQRAAVLTALVFLGLVITACTRSATSGNVPTETPAVNNPDGSGGGDGGGGLETQQDPTMAALGTAIRMTQTAQAQASGGGGGGGGEIATPTPTFAAPFETPTPLPPTATPTSVGCPNPYTVQKGDWIYQIARNCKVDPSAIVAANPGINPNFISPGQQLNMPGPGTGPVPPATAAACTGTHTVVRNENLFRIAYNCGLKTEQLAAFNSIPFPYTIYPGQILRFP